MLEQLKKVTGIPQNDILTETGLDWRIGKFPVYAKTKEGMIEIEDKKAILTNDGYRQLSVCSDNWVIQQNEDYLKLVLEGFNEANLQLTHVGGFNGDRQIAFVGQKGVNSLGCDDFVTENVFVIGSHEYGKGLQIYPLMFRPVCSNVFIGNSRTSGQKIYEHTKTGIKMFTKDIGKVGQVCEEITNEVNTLTQTPINPEEFEALLIFEFGKPKLPRQEQPGMVKTVLRLFERDAVGGDMLTAFETAWGALNAMTEYYSSGSYTNPQDRIKRHLTGVAHKNITKLRASLMDEELRSSLIQSRQPKRVGVMSRF